MSREVTQRIRLECGRCHHVWTNGELPMEASRFARMLKQAQCAKCRATSKDLFIHDGRIKRGDDH